MAEEVALIHNNTFLKQKTSKWTNIFYSWNFFMQPKMSKNCILTWMYYVESGYGGEGVVSWGREFFFLPQNYYCFARGWASATFSNSEELYSFLPIDSLTRLYFIPFTSLIKTNVKLFRFTSSVLPTDFAQCCFEEVLCLSECVTFANPYLQKPYFYANRWPTNSALIRAVLLNSAVRVTLPS